MKLHWEYEFPVAREALWRYVADTDWVNRHANLPPIGVRMEPLPDGGVRRIASIHYGPILAAEWEERPTLWRAPVVFEVERRYTRGPLRLFANRTELVEVDRGTRIVVDVDLQASTVFTRPLLRFIAAQGKAGADKAFALAAKLAAKPVTATAQTAPMTTGASGGKRYFDGLRSKDLDPAVVDAMERLLDESDDRELVKIRPYEVAERYHLARKATLRAFLAAASEGLLNLRWDALCPSCRGTADSFDTLADLKSDMHCPSCNLSYGPQFDRSVEVTFNAKPLGRGGDVPLYCIASPQASEHVITQTLLAPGEVRTIELPFAVGSYDINAIGVDIVPFVAHADETSDAVSGTIDGRTVTFPHALSTGDVQIRLENALERETIVRIEMGRWPDTIATAAHVTALQEFRSMFSSEVLAPGLELSVESMAILFTDLIGSTAMYSRAGDAPAFRIVTDHFAILRPLIEEHDGTIVKTIGDAVMAVFSDPAKCLSAALEMDPAVRGITHDGVPLRLRVGFALGPSIAMRANDKIDYFGTTVNLAARLEAKADAGEVTLTHAAADRPDVAAVLRASGRTSASEMLQVKGFAQPIDVVRVMPDV